MSQLWDTDKAERLPVHDLAWDSLSLQVLQVTTKHGVPKPLDPATLENDIISIPYLLLIFMSEHKTKPLLYTVLQRPGHADVAMMALGGQWSFVHHSPAATEHLSVENPLTFQKNVFQFVFSLKKMRVPVLTAPCSSLSRHHALWLWPHERLYK